MSDTGQAGGSTDRADPVEQLHGVGGGSDVRGDFGPHGDQVAAQV
ncbi:MULTISPECIES: hypothetical protein [unclassified Streptomyces]|nr:MULTISPECIES: hypothetical protein [unclassified Streptomyces]